MGDSGYGEEGTVGQFDVHLHFGIYINDNDGNEISINPYHILKALENNKKYSEYWINCVSAWFNDRFWYNKKK